MIDVIAQPYQALLLFHGGAVAGVVYLLLRSIRVHAGRRWVTHVLDAVFVILNTSIFAGYLFVADHGTVRGFLTAAYAGGFAAAYAVFSPLFSKISQKIRKK